MLVVVGRRRGVEPEWEQGVQWLLSYWWSGQQGRKSQSSRWWFSFSGGFSFQRFCGGFLFVQFVRGCVFAACAGPVGGVSG